MLRKLIAYDFRSQRFLSVLLLLISVGGAVISSALLQLLVHTTDNTSAMAVLMMMGIIMMLIFLLLGTFLSASAVILSVAIHYYKKTVSDEAYLTFTLPATPGQHLTSKMITGSVWMFASTVVMLVDACIIIVPLLFLIDGFTLDTVWEVIRSALNLYYPTDPAMLFGLIGTLLNSLVTMLSQLALLYLSLTIGGIVVNKCKALLGAGIYFGADLAVGIVMQLLLTLLSAGSAAVSVDLYLVITPYLSTLLYAGFTVACYLVNRHLLTEKLNLA